MISLHESGMYAVFQSTHPVRGATAVIAKIFIPFEFQSTHPVRGATVAEVP